MKTFLMCRPTYYDVTYEINPWMSGNIGHINRPLAYKQWHELYYAIKQYANVELIEPHPDYPDMVFTANAGTPFPGAKVVIISQFVAPERRGETPLFQQWFSDRGWGAMSFDCYQTGRVDSKFEGDGDMRIDADGFYWIGHGQRTEERSVQVLQKYLFAVTTVPLRLVNPSFYHLDTCFCPLSHGYVMWYPGAFDEESQQRVREIKRGKLIAVDEHDASLFACNAVQVTEDVILMPWSSQSLRTRLQALGFKTRMIVLSEFIKSGGAACCLTLEIGGRTPHKVRQRDMSEPTEPAEEPIYPEIETIEMVEKTRNI